MLVMKVQRDDMVTIGDDIRIYVRQVSGGGVKLCIDAPRDVEVTRLAAPSRDSRPSAPQVVPGALDETPDGDEREARGSEAAGPR